MSIASLPKSARDEESMYHLLSTVDSPVFVVRDAQGVAFNTDAGAASRDEPPFERPELSVGHRIAEQRDHPVVA